jgi:nicotinamide-nucleotide amidase
MKSTDPFVNEAKELVRTLKKKGLTVATAESITAGGLAAAITEISGASDVFLGGTIAYSDSIKTKILGVPKRLLTKHTAVSEEVAIAMATAVRSEFKSDYAIATTGVAGPGKAYGQKAGTVWIAIVSKSTQQSIALDISGDRASVRHATIESALAAFSRILSA